jgi:hypothetical protein
LFVTSGDEEPCEESLYLESRPSDWRQAKRRSDDKEDIFQSSTEEVNAALLPVKKEIETRSSEKTTNK